VSHLPLEISHCVIKFKDGGVEEIAACAGAHLFDSSLPLRISKSPKMMFASQNEWAPSTARTCANLSVDVALFYDDVCVCGRFWCNINAGINIIGGFTSVRASRISGAEPFMRAAKFVCE
jgi:hypothetical protein